MKITNTDGFRAEFDQQKIIDSLMKETGMTVSQAGVVAQAVAHDIRLMYSEGTIKNVTGSLIREWVCQKLLDWGMQEQHDKYVRVGMPVHDAMLIDWGKEDDANENANLGNTPETGAKHKSDRLSKEQYLMMLGDIAEPHKRGDLHVHDLEYLATRQFCQSHDARWFFRYGLWPDGNGEHSSVSAPAQHAEVAILHLVKVLGTAQTQCAGGQGLLYFNTFLAPYLEGKSYDEIHQLMQMFIYECNQMYVARGGQVVFSSINITPGVPALFRNAPAVFKGQISDRKYGEFEREVRLSFKAILEIAKKGDYLGRPFPFPKIEVCIQKEFLDAESYDEVLSAVTEIKDISEIKRLNEKYGMSEHWYNGSETVAPSYKELYSIAYEVAALNGVPYFDNVMARTTDVEMVGCTQCIPGYEEIPVFRNRGICFIRADEIIESDKVLIPKSGCSSFKSILKREYRGNLIRITTNAGRCVDVTPDHEITIRRNGDIKKLNADEIRINDCIKCGIDLPNIKEVDSRLAYIAGIFAGNGFARNPNMPTSYYTEFTFNADDRNIAERVVRYVKELYDEDASIKEVPGKHAIRVRYYKKKIFQALKSLGSFDDVPTHAHLKRVPSDIFLSSYNARFAFLHGYIHTDGSIVRTDNGLRISASTASRHLANGILLLASSLGYTLHINAMKTDVKYHQRYQITLNKQENIKDFLGGVVHETGEWLQVKKVDLVYYDGMVYDPVDVSGHEFMVSSGLVIGNCCSFTFKSDKNCDVNFHKKVNFIDDQHFTLGGMQVVTINMPRCAYRANREACEVEQGLDEEDCIRILVNEVLTQVDNAVEIFKKKREWMAKARSRLPFLMQQPFDPRTGERAKVPYINHDELVYELGVVGINEMVQYFTGFQLHENKKALRLAVRIMTEMQVYADKLGKELDMNIVISRTPAETVAQRFAVADLINGYADCSKQVIKGDIETAIKNIEDSRNLPIYYSNGFAPWVGADISLADRLKLEEIFWPICAGGAVTHVWLDEKQTDPAALMDFGMKLSKTKIGYFTFTKDRTQCSNCGYSESGIRETCSKCGSDEVDVISRITGYLSNTKNWNAAKRQELEDRKRVVV